MGPTHDCMRRRPHEYMHKTSLSEEIVIIAMGDQEMLQTPQGSLETRDKTKQQQTPNWTI